MDRAAIAEGYRDSSQGDENSPGIVVMDVHVYKDTKSHCSVHFKWVSYMVCESSQ